MGALFQDRLADWPPVVTWDSDSDYNAVENSDQEIPVLEQICERELTLENWVEEDFMVIWSDRSCVKIRCQETDSEDIVKA
jgi:hypothetical protein